MRTNNALYAEDIHTIADSNIHWDKLSNKKILITGATGLIGIFLVDLLVNLNERKKLNVAIFTIQGTKKQQCSALRITSVRTRFHFYAMM